MEGEEIPLLAVVGSGPTRQWGYVGLYADIVAAMSSEMEAEQMELVRLNFSQQATFEEVLHTIEERLGPPRPTRQGHFSTSTASLQVASRWRNC
jgi:hypothetical protein